MARQNGVPVPFESRSPWVCQKAAGFRDIYWCSVLNEPTIIEFREDGHGGREPFCRNCGQELHFMDKEFEELAAVEDHLLIGHVVKPY